MLTKYSLLCGMTVLYLSGSSAAVHANDWNTLFGEWLDAQNWTPAGVPTITEDAVISNDGTATLEGDPVAGLAAKSLRIGVDGGAGRLRVLNGSGSNTTTIEIGEGLDIGVNTNGTEEDAVGTLETTYRVSPQGSNQGPLRVGVTRSFGAARGSWLSRYSGIAEAEGFTEIQIGVSGPSDATANVTGPGLALRSPSFKIGVADDSGNATANVDVRTIELGRDAAGGDLEIGVTHSGDGTATGIVGEGTVYGHCRSIAVGVSRSVGNASGRVSGYLNLEGARLTEDRGTFEVGVADFFGDADGRFLSNFGASQIRSFTNLRVGVSTSDGDAFGEMRVGQGLRFDSIDVGLATGEGRATGILEWVRRRAIANRVTLGEGSTLILGIRGTQRTGSSATYSSIESADVTLDGALVADFAFVPAEAFTIPLVVTKSADGISGDFDTTEVRNLNQGFTADFALVVEEGVEKYNLIVTGAPVFPTWLNPETGANGGDWFDADNWSSPAVPGRGDPTTIGNGGEAVASSSTATGAIEAFRLDVGADGTSGRLSSEGVDINVVRRLAFGLVTGLDSVDEAATGVGNLSDASIRVNLLQDVRDASDPGQNFRGLLVGVAGGTGTANGTLNMTRSDFGVVNTSSGTDLQVGAATSLAEGSSPVANGEFHVDGGTLDLLKVEFGKARSPSRTPGNASGSANVSITDSNVTNTLGGIRVGDSDAHGDGANTSAEANVTLTRVDAVVNGFDIGETEAPDPQTNATSTVVMEIVDSNVKSTQGMYVLDVQADDGGNGSANVEFSLRGTILEQERVLDIGDVEADDDGVGEGQVNVTFVDSSISVSRIGLLETVEPERGGRATLNVTGTFDNSPVNASSRFSVGENVENSSGDGIGSATANVEIRNGSHVSARDLHVASFTNNAKAEAVLAMRVSLDVSDSNLSAQESFQVGVVSSEDQAVMDAEVDLQLANVEATAGGAVTIGSFAGASTEAGNRLVIDVAMDSSSLSSNSLTIAAEGGPAEPDVNLSLESSSVDTGDFTLGAGGTITFALDGLSRVESGTVGGLGQYSAMNVKTAALQGSIEARLDFLPPAGTHHFDLIVVDGVGSLTDQLVRKEAVDLPEGVSVDFFGTVLESRASGDVEVLRLTVTRVAEDLFLRGDCNADGQIDISDAVVTLGSLFLGEGEPDCLDACDSNDDGDLDVSDAIRTLGVLFLGQGVIPLPGTEECGVDPTDDAIGCRTAPRCP